MNVHFTYKLSKTADLEILINQRIEKLQKRLQVFRPDMISLYGSVDEHPKMGFNVALNLRLPSGQLAARAVSDTAASAIKSCFESLKEQLVKHMDHLRAAYKWPRRRRPLGRTRAEAQVPFEETLAAVQADVVSAQDINGWLNANLEKLERFVERELRYRSNSGQLRAGQITPEEVISEAIANALDPRTEKPEKVTLEPWLYFLSRAAIDRLAEQTHTEGEVGLESSVGQEETTGSDEAMLQFHHPDEMLTNENVIPDGAAATPEEIAASDEVMGMIEAALRGARHEDREAFILFTVEGFTVQEIVVITDRKLEDVRASIAKAREQLRKALPVGEQLRNKLIEHSKSA
jgi:DNA-directed RNA polymerase specialized sigma24 family protein/ribosome-associated translation inhibitor RaiA